MSTHVMNLSRSVYLEISILKNMSDFVVESSLKTLAASFILSRLDYCNSLFKSIKGISKTNFRNFKILLQKLF